MAIDYDELITHPRVRAFLDVIARGEVNPELPLSVQYHVQVGGAILQDITKHPDMLVYIPSIGSNSSAAGRYQFLARTWKEAAHALGLPDFGPVSQDKAAVWLLNRRNALQPLLSGNLDVALDRTVKEWASLPQRDGTSYYGQPAPHDRDSIKKHFAQRVKYHTAMKEKITPRPPVDVPNPVPIPQPKEVKVPDIKTRSKSSKSILGVPFIKKLFSQVKWGAIAIVVLPLVNIGLGALGLPNLTVEDIQGWSEFSEWLVLALPAIIAWLGTIATGWLTPLILPTEWRSRMANAPQSVEQNVPQTEEYELRLLLPEQVEKAWGVVCPMIQHALPPGVGGSMLVRVNILSAILREELACWGLFRDEDVLVALLTTRIDIEPITGTRRLFVFSLYALEPLVDEDFWSVGLGTLSAHARSNRCSAIIAYSNIPQMVRLLEKHGWVGEFTLMEYSI